MKNKYIFNKILEDIEGAFVAGGAITSLYTNKMINDFDIYPKSDNDLRNIIETLFDDQWWCSFYSNRAITFCKFIFDQISGLNEKYVIQIMHFDNFENAQKIFDYFDFTVCMGAYDLDSKEFILHDNFLEDCSKRELVVNPRTKYPFSSIKRIDKYKERGYTIDKKELFKLLLACNKIDISSFEDLKEQLGGVYGEKLTVKEGEIFNKECPWESMKSLEFSKFRADRFDYIFEKDFNAYYSCTNKEVYIIPISGDEYIIEKDDNGKYDISTLLLLEDEMKIKKMIKIDSGDVGEFYVYKKVFLIDNELVSDYDYTQKRYTIKYNINSVVKDCKNVSLDEYSAKKEYSYDSGGKECFIIKIRVDSLDNLIAERYTNFLLKEGVVEEVYRYDKGK